MPKSVPVQVVFGKILKEVREEKNLTQEKLAELANFDRTTIYRLESGKRSPALSTLFRLAEALKVTPAHLIDRISKAK